MPSTTPKVLQGQCPICLSVDVRLDMSGSEADGVRAGEEYHLAYDCTDCKAHFYNDLAFQGTRIHPSLTGDAKAPRRSLCCGADVVWAPSQAGFVCSACGDAATVSTESVEALVLELIAQLDEGRGAPWENLVAAMAKAGIVEAAVEEAINSLLDKGLVYEPILGRLKKT